MEDLESRIRARAHEIWEDEGRPEGSAERHWQQANAEIAATEALGPADVAVIPEEDPAPVKKKAAAPAKIASKRAAPKKKAPAAS